MVLTQSSWLRYTKLVFCHPEKCVHSLVSATETIHLTQCLVWLTTSSEFLREDSWTKSLILCKIKSTSTLYKILSPLLCFVQPCILCKTVRDENHLFTSLATPFSVLLKLSHAAGIKEFWQLSLGNNLLLSSNSSMYLFCQTLVYRDKCRITYKN